MCHKLQPSSVKSDGLNSVVREKAHPSTSPIVSNDAGSEREHFPAERTSEIASTENPQVLASGELQSFAIAGSSVAPKDSANSIQTAGPSTSSQDGRPGPRSQELRCDVARSVGYDPTGEHAVACGALVQVVCEYCGPMCASCAEETFCFYGEHKLTQLPDDGPLPPSRTRRRPVNEVVYVEIKCPNCNRVRLALPKKHRPKGVRKCPICKAKAPAEYLAHGFTRRRLPYHEVFTTQADPNEMTILPSGTRRLPWDTRHWADYKE